MLTITDYLIVMNDVRIADLKSKLSEYLRKVRRGHSLTVLDRETPIARLVPYEADAAALPVRRPVPGAPALQSVALPPPLRIKGDIVTLLLEEREADR
ncbi:MAG: type II toxin-antitoxin system prevent-host-death family antitoxin [Acidobacteriota bacterium]